MCYRERMASIEKRAKSFRVVWREDGMKQTESFLRRSEAERFRELLDANGGRRPDGWQAGRGYGDALTVADLHAEWLTRQVSDSNRELVATRFRTMIADRPFAKERIGDVSTELVRDLARVLLADYTPLTAREVVKNLRSAFDYAARSGYVRGDNPFTHGLIPEPKQSRAVFLRDYEITAALDALPADWRLVARTLLDSGLRIGELYGLRVHSVAVNADGRVTFEVDKTANLQSGKLGPTKGRQTRYVSLSLPVSRDVAALASGRNPGERLFALPSYSTVQRVWANAVRDAGLLDEHPNGVRIHDLRHTHASRMLRAGASLFDVSKRLGHTNIAITAKYYGHIHPDNERLNAVLDALAE